jgi:cytoskeletal protein RodZ
VPDKTHIESPSLESLGQFLLEEREKAGLTRSDLASKTRIAIDQIAKMEEGRFTHLPPVYARGFLKTLAWALNLDPEVMLSEYRRLSGNKENDPARPLHPKKYVDADIIDEGGSNLGLSLLLIAVIFGIVAGLYFFNPVFRQLVTGYLPFLEKSSSQPTQSAAPLNQTLVAPAAAVSPPQPQNGGRLTLRAVKATWSQVQVDSEGLKFVYFQPGQSQSFESQKSIKVIAGDGQALKAEWNGQDLGFLGPQGTLELAFPLNR